jgi:Helix-turn-helix
MMSEALVVVEPRGHTTRELVRLDANRLRTEPEIRSALEQSGRQRVLWIAPDALAVKLLLAAFLGRSKGDQRLLALGSANGARHPLLHAVFRVVVSADEGIRLLPIDELADVLGSPHRADLFVGGAGAPNDAAVILYRGNLEPLIVPLAWFKARPDGPKPDLDRLAVADFGQTVCLGEYEAATDAILYEFDDAYRRRAKRRELGRDSSLGGSLRRLRLQKGLQRKDFRGLTPKEIARIERGEVKKPHPRTLAILAKRLGVPAKQLSTY